MNASSFLIVLIQTTLCLSVGLIVCAIARKSSGVRLIVSQMGIVVSAMILIVSSMIILQVKPMVSVSVPEAVAFTVPITNKGIVPTPQIETTPNKKGDNNLAQVEQRSATNPIYQTTSSFTISKLVSMAYGFGLVFSLIPMVLGAWWIRRARKMCLGVTAGTAFDVVKSISERQGIRAPRLYASEAITIPFVSGLFRKQIFVPINWVNGQCDIACRAILEHEIAHVVSRDLERKFLCRLACTLVWFQPLVWIAFRVMSNASEELCDQRVLMAGVSNTSYANTLMQIRENAKRSNVPGLVIGAVSRESNLAKRMKLILATNISQVKKVSKLVGWVAVIFFTAMATTSTLVFGQTEHPKSAQEMVDPYSGSIKLMDSFGKPIIGAKATLIIRSNDDQDHLLPLKIKGDAVEIPGEVTIGSAVATLLIETADGGKDFKRLWPARTKLTEYRVSRPVTIRGKIGFPNSLTGPVKLSVHLLIRSGGNDDDKYEFAVLEKVYHEFKSTQSDREGDFELAGMPSGTEIVLGVDDDRFSFDSMSMRVKIDNQGNFKPLNYKLLIASSISGTVTRDGKAVAGMMIAAQGQKKHSWSEAVTDENGKYILKRLIPDFYNVAAKLSELEQTEFTVRAKVGIFLKEGEHKTEADLTVEPGGIISGTLTDSVGKPIPNGMVGIYGPAHPHSTAWVQGIIADDYGRFQTRVPSGLNEVYFAGGTEHPVMVRVDVRDGMESKVQVIGERSNLSGEPNTPDSNPKIANFDNDKSFGPMTLPDKSSISLMYLCQGQSPNTVVVWRPDGTIDRSSKYLQDLEAVDYFNDPSIGGHIWARLRVTNTHSKKEVDSFRFEGDSKLQTGMWTSTFDASDNQSEILIQMIPGKPSVGNIKILVPFGPFKSLYRGKPNATYRAVKTGSNGQVIEFDFPKEFDSKEITVYAKDTFGRSLALTGIGLGNMNRKTGLKTWGYNFQSKNPVSRIEVLTREMEVVSFKGIHLQPNKM